MSKLVNIDINCPNCGSQYREKFFRTIWGEHESNRQMVMEDRINIASCPCCKHSFHLPLAMMYVDVEKQFAVWWEPNYDSGIDSDSAGYAQIFGLDNFYSVAPRVSDWNEFKSTINKYYSGELVAPKILKINGISGVSKKKSGCLGSFVGLAIFVGSLLYVSINIIINI